MGRLPVPLSQFILKVASRCDLACDHCYVYESADQSWRLRPRVVPDAVTAQAAQRIAGYARANHLATVRVVLHGGEPLLAGPARLRLIMAEFRSALRGICRLDLAIHTNGVLLDEQYCELFAEYGVQVGVSIDGDRAANDRHRRYADGRSSHGKVIQAIDLLRTKPFRGLYAGLLCTIDVANDPESVYQALMELEPPQVDFLLPHSTWDHPPTRAAGAPEAYGDWLIAVYDRWIADGRPARIRTFDSLLSTLAGGGSFTEALGLGSADLAVIETDGSYELVDSLKVAFDGAPRTGYNVFDHGLDTVAGHPGVVARQQGLAGLCQTCQDCPVAMSCGGGLYTHRYRTGSGFDNPSVYCADLIKLISHVARHRPPGLPGGSARPAHPLSGTSFRALAGGTGDSAAMAQLIEAERSVQRALLGKVGQAAAVAPGVPAAARTRVQAAWTVLTLLDRQQPAALRALLAHPYVRAWAVRCLGPLGLAPAAGGGVDPAGAAADLDHLSAIAAAAAARAGMGTSLMVPVLGGAVHLPTLGRLVLGPAVPGGDWVAGEPGMAVVSVITNAVIIRVADDCWTLGLPGLVAGEPGAAAAAGNRPAQWQPVRVLSGDGYRVVLEDTDPYRDCYPWRPAPRLPDEEAGRWQQALAQAWQVIVQDHGPYAAGLSAGLTTLTPLASPGTGHPVSVAARQAFGAVAAARPPDPVTLALLLIEAFQAVKLGAVLDLCDLYDPAVDRSFHAPWGDGKYELGELLQGTYARLAAADFWRVRERCAAGPAAGVAARRSRQGRDQVAEAMVTLLGSGALTPLGASFVRGMSRSLGA
jgi:uncharacterized protein